MSKRKYPENCSDKMRREIDGLSDFSAYAFGFSDEKPGAASYIAIAIVILGAVWSFFKVTS